MLIRLVRLVRRVGSLNFKVCSFLLLRCSGQRYLWCEGIIAFIFLIW